MQNTKHIRHGYREPYEHATYTHDAIDAEQIKCCHGNKTVTPCKWGFIGTQIFVPEHKVIPQVTTANCERYIL